MMKRLWVALMVGMATLEAGAQARPTASRTVHLPQFEIPTVGGMLRYSLTASETLSKGLYRDTGLLSSTNLSGNVAFTTQSPMRPFSLVYSGGYLFATAGQPSPFFQNLIVSQRLRVKGFDFIASDSVSYQPATANGGLSGVPGVGDVGVVPVGTGGAPALGILTNYGPHISNAATGSVGRSLTASLQLLGGGYYSMQRYFGDGTPAGGLAGIDSTAFGGNGGFSYRIDARNNVGTTFTYSQSSFNGGHASFTTEGISGTYSRQWTRKVSTRISGGPLAVSSKEASASTSINLTAGADVTYQGKVVDSSLSYLRDTGSGSGVISGAIFDSFQANAHRTLGRDWGVAGTLGYGRTTNLPGATTTQFSSNGYTASAQLTRAVSRRTSSFASYTYADQSLRDPAQPSNVLTGAYHVVGFGITYSPGEIHIGAR